jgi:hypothetical protein
MSESAENGQIVQDFKNRFGTFPGSGKPEKECAQWQQMCQALLMELTALKQDYAQVQAERDQYCRSMLHLLDKEVNPADGDLTMEEIAALARKGPSFKELLETRFKG